LSLLNNKINYLYNGYLECSHVLLSTGFISAYKYLHENLSDIEEFRVSDAKSKWQRTQFYQRLMALISLRAMAR